LLFPPIQIGGPDGLRGAGQHGVSIDAEVTARDAHRFSRPRLTQHDDGFVGQFVALVEGDAERGELRVEVAASDSEDDAPAAERVERRDALRAHERIAVREHEQVRVQTQRVRRRRGKAQCHERIQCVVSTVCEPVVGRERVIRDEDGIESRILGRARDVCNGSRGDELRRLVDTMRR
jgi:hypothetical protein